MTINKLSATQVNFGNVRGQGFLGFENESIVRNTTAFGNLGVVISTIIGVLTIIATIWLTIKLIIGAIGIISAGGDKSKLAQSRSSLTMAIVGFVIVISSYFIIKLVEQITGLSLLSTLDWFEIFQNLIP